jgi:transcription elongation factor SPT5
MLLISFLLNTFSKNKNKFRTSNFGPIRDKKLIGTTIKITGGPYKGNIGIVKDATECTVRVELHSPCHTISVDRSHIITTESNVDKSSTHNNTPTYCPGARTPMYGSKDDSKLSLLGSQTPMYDSKCIIFIMVKKYIFERICLQ